MRINNEAIAQRLIWLPLPAFAVALVALYLADGRTSYESPALLLALNIVFSTVAAGFVAYLCARSFLVRAEPGLLLLGCGALAWGAACGVAAGFVRSGGNITVTIHNLGVWLFALLSLAAAGLAARPAPPPPLRAPQPWLAAAYFAGLAAVALIAAATYEGWLPVFFVQGRGGTPVRQVVLGSSIGMLALTAALFAGLHRRRRQPSRFHTWYALGLALLALGLAGVMLEPVHGGLLSWAGRAAQYAGGVYLLAAGLAALRDDHCLQLSLAASLYESQSRLAAFASATFEGIVESEGGRIVDCNEPFAQMLGYGVDELRGKPVAELVAQKDRARILANIAANRDSVTESELLRKDGRALIVEARGNACAHLGTRRFTAIRDITDRKRAEAALLASEEAKFSTLFHSSAEGILLADPETRRLTLYNEAICRMLGYSAAELSTMRVDDIHPAESRLNTLRTFEGCRRGSLAAATEIPVLKKDGTVFFADITVAPITVAGKSVLAGFFRDITERKRAQEALAADAIRRRILVEQSSDGIVILDQGGKVYEANRRYAEMLGYSPEEVQRLHVWDWDCQWSREQLTEMINRVDEAGAHFETRHRRKDGAVLDVEVSTNAALLDGQKLTFCVCRDISERKRIELELRRLAQVVEQTAEIIVVADSAFAVVYVNPAFERITGFSRDEAQARSFWTNKVGRQDAGELDHVRAALTRGELWRGRLTIRRKDGTRFTADAIISPLRDAEGRITHYVATERDLSREQELETQVAQAQKMEAVGRLAGGVAHDFNNLLQSILGHCELLQPELAQAPHAAEDLQEIEKAAQRAADLTGQLLAFSRKQLITPSLENLNAVVAGMQKMLGRIIGEDIVITLELAERLPAVRVDVGQIHQVVMNLAVNARDAMPGGGRLSIRTECVELSEEAARALPDALPGTFVRLSVSDTGTGMSEALLAQIFEPFFTTKGLGKGTGLGLSVIYGIVRQHEGWITVFSEVGRGTTFHVYLPTAASEAQAAGEDAKPAPPPGAGERILVIEDEPGVRTLAARFLNSAGYEVVASSDAAEGEAAFARDGGRFDLLFCDVVLPDRSGLAVVESLLRGRPDLPVLFTTGYTDERACWDAIERRRHRHLLKPYAKADLLRAVRELLDAQPSNQA